MIKNFWSKIKIYCGNNHNTPIEFTVKAGESPFYACPKYMLKDNKHPNGHTKDERACPNRLNFIDAQGIVEKFSDIVEKDIINDKNINYEGLEFKYKHYEIKVFKYTDNDIKISVINKKALS